MKLSGRRQFLKKGLQSALFLLLPSKAFATIEFKKNERRTLSFYNLHTHETLDICYFKDNAYQYRALKKINTILRDHRTGEVKFMDMKLLDILHEIKVKTRSKAPFHIISGYRSPKSNAMLRGKSKNSGVAKKSLHMKGQAIDIRLPDCNLEKLYKTCIRLKKGGVGFYKKSNFVHIDTGRVRSW